MYRFDSEEIFREILKQGINLFCGAGFSVEALDSNNNKLPLGEQLLTELKQEFNIIQQYTNLAKATTKIKTTDSATFNSFLQKRFTVYDYDPLYDELLKINLKNIYTTNIDDLFYKMFTKSGKPYMLYDRTQGDEPIFKEKIDYFPLHGYVQHRKPHYIFTTIEVATAFESTSRSTWDQLGSDASTEPMLFWGWNFQDTAPIEAMFGKKSKTENNIHKWFLLHSKDGNASAEDLDFLETLGFNIILGDTIGMLNYIKLFNQTSTEDRYSIVHQFDDRLRKYIPPKNTQIKKHPPISEYYTNYSPEWSYIYGEQVHKLNYFKEIINDIANGNNVAIIGIHCSGKTTLLMQLIAYYTAEHRNKAVYHMSSPSEAEVKMYLDLIDRANVLLFVDDCFRDTNAVIALLKSRNIQLVFADRERNYENQVYKLDKTNFSLFDITEILQKDAQKIIDTIPSQLLNRYASTKYHEKDPTIINLLATTLRTQNFQFIKSIFRKDENIAQLILLICYVHACGTPCSFDMVYSFLGDTQYSYKEMFEIVNKAIGVIEEYSDIDAKHTFFSNDQDYYRCRSRYLAEKILYSIPRSESQYLANVLMQFLERVSTYKIYQYDKFKRSAYDSSLMAKAFPKVNEGRHFYEKAVWKDGSEYIYQQAALYFADLGDYREAFEWIERAKGLSNYNRFSIDSTYAQIYFAVNIETDKENSSKALDILMNCSTHDRRKSIHFSIFAKKCIQFYNRYRDEDSLNFVKKAYDTLNVASNDTNMKLSHVNKKELSKLREELKVILDKNIYKPS